MPLYICLNWSIVISFNARVFPLRWKDVDHNIMRERMELMDIFMYKGSWLNFYNVVSGRYPILYELVFFFNK